MPDSVLNIAKKMRKKLKIHPKHSTVIEDFIVSLNHSFQKAERKYKKMVNAKAKQKIKKIKVKYLRGGEVAFRASADKEFNTHHSKEDNFEFNDIYSMFKKIRNSREYKNYERDI